MDLTIQNVLINIARKENTINPAGEKYILMQSNLLAIAVLLHF